jgi:serine/threonine-protein kinase RsbW
MSSVSAVFANKRTEIERVVQLAERFGEEHQLAADIVMTIHLVLDELVANIITHGYDDTAEHQIRVTLTLDEALLGIRVEDDGRPFDPLALPPPDLDLPLEDRPVGGLGIHIVRSVMDDVEYRREGDHNVLIMKKTIGRSS